MRRPPRDVTRAVAFRNNSASKLGRVVVDDSEEGRLNVDAESGRKWITDTGKRYCFVGGQFLGAGTSEDANFRSVSL
jgi:hypothetical protein